MIGLSLILIDWKVRESFHALEFLARQSVPRDQYEVIWVEHYNHRPAPLADAQRRGLIDQWIVLDRDDIYFKHRMYNEGLLAARGELVTVCDSDACFSPNFVRSVLEAFERSGDQGLVLYHEEVRSDYRGFHPFPSGTTWDDVMSAPGLMNWDARAGRPRALTLRYDPLHTLNYGACCTVRREDAIAVGGYDEHPQYHSFICGPYELGFRLLNRGHRELWHPDEWLLHTWHPWVRPDVDIFGHHDGRNVSSLALEARRTGRVLPYRENDRVRALRLQGRGKTWRPPRSDAFAILEPPEVPPAAARRGARIVHTPRLARALYLAPFAADDPVACSLESSGLVAELETFSYDTYVLRFGQEFMERQLGILCRQFRPELIVFAPLSSPLPSTAGDPIEPPPGSLRALAQAAGARLLLWSPSDEALARWATVVDLVALPLGARRQDGARFLGGSSAPPRTIEVWPSPDDRLFHPARGRRDIPLFADGPMVCGSEKENLLALLDDEGAGVAVRRLAFRPDERATIYRRARIVLNLRDGIPDSHRAGTLGAAPEFSLGSPETQRALEAMACGSCVVQEKGIPMPPGFEPGRDYLVFEDASGVGSALATASRPGVAERIGAAGHARVAMTASPRAAWLRIFAESGANLLEGAAGSLRHWVASSALGVQWRRRAERQKLVGLKKVAIFGAGPSGVVVASRLRKAGYDVVAWIDNAADRQGKLLENLPIHAPEWLMGEGPSLVEAVVLGFQGRKNPVRWQLADLGWTRPVVEY